MYLPDNIIDQLWNLVAVKRNGVASSFWGKDLAGAWIRKDQFDKHSQYGWVIDHVKPKTLGGTDELDNLQPLHWRNNMEKGTNYPNFDTCISSAGEQNIIRVKRWHVAE